MKVKLKNNKSAFKRINAKKRFLSRKKAFCAHFLRRKSAKRLRSLAAPANIHKADKYIFTLLLPYRYKK